MLKSESVEYQVCGLIGQGTAGELRGVIAGPGFIDGENARAVAFLQRSFLRIGAIERGEAVGGQDVMTEPAGEVIIGVVGKQRVHHV